MSLVHHGESAKIVNQAIAALQQEKKGLADRLNKDPSLISRYASGAVRPKAETLLECMKFIQEEVSGDSENSQLDRKESMYKAVKEAVMSLSVNDDADLIYALFKVLQVAQKF